MAEIAVSIPETLEAEIERMVDDGEFVSREQAIEELLTNGLQAYSTTEDEEPVMMDEEVFSQTVEDQMDPARRESGDDQSF